MIIANTNAPDRDVCHFFLKLLNINVTERSRRHAHRLAHCYRLARRIPSIDHRVERRISRARQIQERTGAGDGVLALRQIEVLPNSPHAINHAMMVPEGRVTRRHKHITAGVAAHRVVATPMHTNRTATGDTLHGKLEVGDIVVVEDQAHHRREIRVLLNEGSGKITLQTLYSKGLAAAADPPRGNTRAAGPRFTV